MFNVVGHCDCTLPLLISAFGEVFKGPFLLEQPSYNRRINKWKSKDIIGAVDEYILVAVVHCFFLSVAEIDSSHIKIIFI